MINKRRVRSRWPDSSNPPSGEPGAVQESAWDAPRRMLLSLAERLWMEYGAPARYELPELLTQIREGLDRSLIAAQLLRDTLDHVSLAIRGVSRRVVLWIDGLDEAFGPGKGEHDTPRLRQLLPNSLPDGVFIVLTSRPGDHLDWLSDPRFCARHWLDDATAERAASVRDIEQYLTNKVEEANLRPEPNWIRRAAQRTEGNFYVAYLMFERIRRSSDAPENPDDLPVSVEDFHDRILRDVVAAAGKRGILECDVRTTLAMLALAAEPMALEHLQALGAPDSAEEVLSLAADWFVPRPPRRAPELPFEFNHSSVREFLARRLTTPETLSTHVTLARACARWRAFADDGVRHYALRHRFGHLISAKLWDDVAAAFGEADFIVEMAKHCGFHEVHSAACRVARFPGLPEARKKAFAEWERFLRWRVGYFHLYPDTYAEEVANEFLSAVGVRACTGSNSGSAAIAVGVFSRTKVFGPPSIEPGTHVGPIACLAISPDQERLASGGEGGEVRVWSVEREELDSICVCPTAEPVTGIAFSADGAFVAAAMHWWPSPRRAWVRSGIVCVWDALSGQMLWQFVVKSGDCESVTFSPNGKCVAGRLGRGRIGVWSLETGTLCGTCRPEQEFETTNMAYSSDSRWLASVGGSRSVTVWDAVTTARVFSSTRVGAADLDRVAFTEDGKRLLAIARDGAVCMWDMETWSRVLPEAGKVTLPEPTPDPACRSAAQPSSLRIPLDLAAWAGQTTMALAGVRQEPEITTATCVSQKRRAEGYLSGRLRVADVCTGRTLFDKVGRQRRGITVALDQGGEWAAVLHRLGRRLRVVDAVSGQEVAEHSLGSVMTAVALSQDGGLVALGDVRGTVSIIRASNGALCFESRAHTAAVCSVTLSGDGTHLISCSTDGAACIWHVPSGQRMASFGGVAAQLALGSVCLPQAVFSPDGLRIIAPAWDDGFREIRIRFWDAMTGMAMSHTSCGISRETWLAKPAMGHSPDGEVFCLAIGSTACLCSTRVELSERYWQDPGGVIQHLALARHEGALVSAAEDGCMRVWDSRAGKLVCTCNDHRMPIACVAVSSDSGFAASSAGGEVLVWDAHSGDRVAAFFYSQPVVHLWFQARGGHLVMLDSLGQIRSYSIS
jgi:WD40 repeat protein